MASTALAFETNKLSKSARNTMSSSGFVSCVMALTAAEALTFQTKSEKHCHVVILPVSCRLVIGLLSAFASFLSPTTSNDRSQLATYRPLRKPKQLLHQSDQVVHFCACQTHAFVSINLCGLCHLMMRHWTEPKWKKTCKPNEHPADLQ